MRGGYRVSNKLKKDLFDIKTLAETSKSIAEVSESLGKEDRKGLISNSNKIKELINPWIGVD